MAVGGLLALLEDITSTLDDVSTLEQLAVEKSAKIAEDDMTAHVENGKKKLNPKHEISVIMAVAKGSLKSKVLFFIPTTFAIATLAPWAVVPLSVASGLYISYEGTKKFLEKADPAKAAKRRAALNAAAHGGKETLLRYEKDRISQAIKTDAALSLELAGIHIGMATGAPLLTKLAILTVAGIGTTTLIYAGIIGIIKMDDVALHLARRKGDHLLAKAQRKIGRGMLRAAAPVMKAVAGVGMTALFYLGGHLLAENVPLLHHGIEALKETISGVGVFENVATVSVMIATGVASGFAAVGLGKAVEKPARYIKDKLRPHYQAHLSGPVKGVKKTLKRGLDKALRRDRKTETVEMNPRIEFPDIPPLRDGQLKTVWVPLTRAQSEQSSGWPRPGTLVSRFEVAGEKPATMSESAPKTPVPAPKQPQPPAS